MCLPEKYARLVKRSGGSKTCVCVLSHIQLFATPWTSACQAPLFMGFSRQDYWSGLPFRLPGDLPDPGIKPESPVSPALADRVFTTESPGKLSLTWIKYVKHDIDELNIWGWERDLICLGFIDYIHSKGRFKIQWFISLFNFLNIGHHPAF